MYLVVFCNLINILDRKKFLQFEKTAVTALVNCCLRRMHFFPAHGSAVRAASRDTSCMKSACRAKQPTPTAGCHCSKMATSSRTTLPGTMPRQYAVTYSDFIHYGANRNDDSVLLLAFFRSCFVAALSILSGRSAKFEFEIRIQSDSCSIEPALWLMRPPRAAERRSFEGLQLLLLPLVPSDRARRRILRLAGLCLAGRQPFLESTFSNVFASPHPCRVLPHPTPAR
jgi:hypothetical protein